MLCHVAALKKSPRTPSKCRLYFIFFGNHWANPGVFENRIPLKPELGDGSVCSLATTVLHIKRLSQTESPIFMILCVLCFQRQSGFSFSLSEHEVLVVSYCGQSMSVVRRAASTIALKAYSSYTPWPFQSVGSVRVTCRSKTAKIVPIENPRWPPRKPS